MPPTNEEEIKKLIWSCYQRSLKYSYSSSLSKRRAMLDEATEEVKHFYQKAKQLAEELKTPPTAPPAPYRRDPGCGDPARGRPGVGYSQWTRAPYHQGSGDVRAG